VRSAANQPLVGSHNRHVVLDAIRSAGTASRVELVEVTGLTAAAVGGIVRRLIADELVIEVGHGASRGGKPRTLLRVRPGAAFAAGVHLDADATTYVLADLAGTVSASATGPGVGGREPKEAVEVAVAGIRRLLRGIDAARVTGIGVATAGPLDHRAGIVHDPPALPGWHSVPLRDLLAERLDLPIVVDNEATAAALAERWVGHARDVRDAVCVHVGTGIGAGIILDGQVRRGATSNAGSLGHVSVNADGPVCPCGNRGCLELYCGLPALVASARRLRLLPRRRAGLRADYLALCQAAVGEQGAARELVEQAARYLGEAVVTLVNLVDPRLVVLSGFGVAAAADVYRDGVSRALDRHPVARRTQHIEVRSSMLGNEAAAVGAATLALDAGRTEFLD
jgi:predicted NBD/HSP70 family sugar kinase